MLANTLGTKRHEFKDGLNHHWPVSTRTAPPLLNSPSPARDEVIESMAGHVPRAMLSRYSHVRMEAQRRALDEIAARQRAADEKRGAEAERQQQAPPFPE